VGVHARLHEAGRGSGPTTTQLGRQDLADRMTRGDIRHVVISGKIRRVELRALEVHRRSGRADVELEFWEHEFPELSEAPAPPS
jgi:hypothetical protein